MKTHPDITVCDGCDAVFTRAPLRRREVATCPRCGTELERHSGTQHQRMLPLTVAALIMFLVANLFPIVEIELRGLHSETTLFGAIVTLTSENMPVVALMVLVTTLLFPLLQLLLLLWLLIPLRWHRRVHGFALMVRAMQSMRPWGMVEVFLLGVLVALVKLAGLATVIPGPALWAFMALTVLMTAIMSFDPRGFWEMLDDGQKDEVEGEVAQEISIKGEVS